MSVEWVVLEESHLLLLDPDALMSVVEEEELVVDDDDASSATTPFAEDEMFVDEPTGTLSDVISDGEVFPFV